MHGKESRPVRLVMTFCALSPLFILMGIRDNLEHLFPGHWVELICALLGLAPIFLIILYICLIKQNKEFRKLAIDSSEDRSEYVFTYLFAILLPFYLGDVETYRDLAAMGFALFLVFVVFYRLELNYFNVFLAIFGYRIFVVEPIDNENTYNRQDNLVLIARGRFLKKDQKYTTIPVTDTIYLEVKP